MRGMRGGCGQGDGFCYWMGDGPCSMMQDRPYFQNARRWADRDRGNRARLDGRRRGLTDDMRGPQDRPRFGLDERFQAMPRRALRADRATRGGDWKPRMRNAQRDQRRGNLADRDQNDNTRRPRAQWRA